MNRRLASFVCSLFLAGQLMPASMAASQPDLNFKIYSPPDAQPAGDSGAGAAAAATPATGQEQTPKSDDSSAAKAPEKPASDSLWSTDSNSSATDSAAGGAAMPAASSGTDAAAATTTPAATVETPATDNSAAATDAKPADSSTDGGAAASGKSDKVLKGYIRVVPSGTKIPIIMDTAVDSDTSQEGDEFAARSSEDLNIDGQVVVPAGSVIKGRIAQLNAPRNMGRSGSVALKFDTVTTPDNRQIPLVANLVARGGVVHARRGLKDIAMDTTTFALPTALGIGIGALAGSSSKSSSSSGSSKKIGKGTGALIGAGVGAAVGIAILCIKKGKKVDVRPGDELKIELAEDLRMPM